MGKKSKRGAGEKSKSKPKQKQKRLQKSQKPRNHPKPEPLTSTPDQNPFEMRVNKRKHDNLGRRGRNELGVPGISRGKAIEKRNKTLLQEYKVRNKSSVLLDNRIGEKRKAMPEEEKIVRRSAAEKARQFKHNSIFNLHETDEFLTHRGQPLDEIDRYEDPRDASDSEDERLNADFVSDANFGGFMRIKRPEEVEPNEEDVHDDGQPKTHKEIIHELILASKKKKYEKAKEADENYELVCKLDEEFKNPDFRNLLFGVAKDKHAPEQNEPVGIPPIREEYDTLVKELQFETKTGRAADRLKTEDEVADEEKGKLEQLERDRLRRMQMTDPDGSLKHRSADDLDDGFHVDEVDKEDSKSDADDTSEDEEESDAEDSSKDEDAEDSEASDSYNDVESDSETELQPTSSGRKAKQMEDTEVVDGEIVSKKLETDNFEDIPFVLEIPIKYKEFEKMLKTYKGFYGSRNQKQSTATLNVILSRIIKYNTAADRTRLPQLFNYIVRYALEVTEAVDRLSASVRSVCGVILPHLHTLLVLNPTSCMEAVEKGELFDDFYPIKKLPLFKILYFDLCSHLFCCTDFNHHVLSPIKSKLSDVLRQYKVTDIKSLGKIFYVLRIMYKLCHESKRYSPEVLTSLCSILVCYTGTRYKSTGSILPSMSPVKMLLHISNDELGEIWKLKKTTVFDVLAETEPKTCPTVEQKYDFFYFTLKITQQFVDLYERLPSSKEVFAPIRKALCALKEEGRWPRQIARQINETFEAINSIKQKKEALAISVSDKPKPLKLYEPLVDEDFDGMRKKKAPKGKQETARLTHKVKQETKSAVREIRKDTAFLATQQLREQLEKDSERKRKVKEIMGSLANQEGEYQKSKRGKK